MQVLIPLISYLTLENVLSSISLSNEVFKIIDISIIKILIELEYTIIITITIKN